MIDSKKIYKSQIKGIVYAPSSKSVMQRAVALAFLTEGKSIIINPSYSEDGLAAINLVTNLGVKKEILERKLILKSSGRVKNDKTFKLTCGESGLCMRMFAPILSLFRNEFILNGEGSLQKRTVKMIEDDLKKFGADCKTDSGFAPIYIKGVIDGRNITIDGAISSQFLSGLLIALPLCLSNSVLKVVNLKSRPYVNLTLKMIEDAGVIIKSDSKTDTFFIEGKQKYKPIDVEVEGDWSGSSFLLVAGAIAGEIIIKNLKLDSLQADKAILDVLELSGAEIVKSEDYVKVKKNKLMPFEFDISESPDIFPPIAVLAALCKGKSIVYGTERLKYKESSRAEVIKKEFKKLGIRVELFDNKVEIYGGQIMGGKVSANNDHRISMALSLMGLVSKEAVEIDGWESITKSYPDFFKDLEEVGGKIK